MATAHTRLAEETIEAFAKAGLGRMWRNETGKAQSFDGKRVIKYGLTGSTDNIGITCLGIFIGAEIKIDEDYMKEAQINFREMILKNKGLHFEIRNQQDIEAMIKTVRERHEKIKNYCY